MVDEIPGGCKSTARLKADEPDSLGRLNSNVTVEFAEDCKWRFIRSVQSLPTAYFALGGEGNVGYKEL
jgi:hypothetical protein